MKVTPTKDIAVELGVVPGVPLADDQLLVNVFGSGRYPLETIHISTYERAPFYQPYCRSYQESVPRLCLTKGTPVRICNKCIKAAQLPENQ